MCGLIGFLSTGLEHQQGTILLMRMTDKIAHRGPDADGIWFDEQSQIGLGHRRLSILDLSPAGAQPMTSPSGRYVMAFNGEIYNHLVLRNTLTDSIAWRGHSDTETLLACFDAWGIEATVKASVGMFAFAVWDKETGALTLGRDRVGEKPLYYGWQQKHFLFGSELKALKAHPAFQTTVNRDALALFMQHNTIAAPYSIWQGIHKLMPGCLLRVSYDRPEPVITRYWSVLNNQSLFQGTFKEASLLLEETLCRAIDLQMMADVPVGAFLSGGVDSSLIVALMQTCTKTPVRTFSIGFHEAQYNEAQHAKAVASYLGTEHTELYVTAKDACAVIPHLPSIYDEPFADSSQIPTFLVSQLAKQHVSVALTGDAGDELFGGYGRYLMANQLWSFLSKMPLTMRKALGNGLSTIPPKLLNSLSVPLMKVLPSHLRVGRLGDKMHKGARMLSSPSILDVYHKVVSHWQDPEQLVVNATLPLTAFSDIDMFANVSTNIERMMMIDMMTYLPDDILTKVDRAAMHVSLETRVPFLDHRVIALASSLPLSYKIHQNQGKVILKDILYRHIPKDLIERPKMGFGIPLGSWLRGDLREWAEDLLNESRLNQEGFFQATMIRKKWAEHLSGRMNWQHLLWDVLMFQAWLNEQ